MKLTSRLLTLVAFCGLAASCNSTGDTNYDVIIRGGTVYDGLGAAPFEADVAINGDRIAAIGNLSDKVGHLHIDAGQGAGETP